MAQRLSTRQATGDVVTHVDDGARLGLCPKEMIEGDDAPSLRGRDGQAAADVVESASTDPPNSILDRMERWKEQVAPLLHLSKAASRNPGLTTQTTSAADPSRFRRPE
jgi:hypothetical protein